MEPKWKLFERLVAAIHQALSTAGATVEWEEKLDGREFDVIICFDSFGYKYLTVIECRNYDVPVGDVEAFVTKSRRAKANKVVMVSSEGFQSGAITVARDEGIELYVLKEAQVWPEQIKVQRSVPALAIMDVEIISRAGKVIHRFPTESSALEYFMLNSKCTHPNAPTRTLHEVIMAERPSWEGGLTSEKQTLTIALPPRTSIEVPYLDPFKAAKLRFRAAMVSALVIDSRGIDPSMIPLLFSFKNVVTGEDRNISETDIWIDFNTEVRPGKYYFDPIHDQSYYCERIEGDVVQYVLLESYQHGKLVQARVRQKVSARWRVIEVTDATQIKRLERMYKRYTRS